MTTTITPDDLIEVDFALGSGYGVGTAEVPDKPGTYTVVLVNEDPGDVLCELRRFSLSTQAAAREFQDSILAAIQEGRGEAIQQIGERR